MRIRMRVILTRDSVRSPFAEGMMGGRTTCQGWFGLDLPTDKKATQNGVVGSSKRLREACPVSGLTVLLL